MMIGLWTHGDLLRHREDVEKRRMQMQGNLWMAMALCRNRIVSLSYSHEILNTSLRIAAPEASDGKWYWTSMFVHCLVEGGVLEGWTFLVTEEARERDNDGRDTHMVDRCLRDSLTLVHRDGGAGEEARLKGVKEMSPEAYAETMMSWTDARDMLLKRLHTAVTSWPDRHPPQQQELRRAEAVALWEVYWAVCEPPGAAGA